MKYVVQKTALLHAAPGQLGPNPPILHVNDELEKISDEGLPDWIKVTGLKGEGFIPSDSATPVGAHPEIDHAVFFLELRDAVLQLPTGSGTNYQYLFAVAMAESQIKNIPSQPKDSDPCGPFQYTKARWVELVAKFGASVNINPDDRTSWRDQASIAAAEASHLAVDLQAALGRLPTYNELYLAHVLAGANSQKAVQVVQAIAATPPPTATIDSVLKANGWADANIGGFLTVHDKLLQDGGRPAAPAKIWSAATEALTPGFNEAAQLGAQYDPADPPAAPADLVAARGAKPGVANLAVTDVQYTLYTGGGNIDSWITQACQAAGVQPTTAWVQGYKTLCSRESSNNPNAINKTDGNAKGASAPDNHPLGCSRGIAQCIPRTFASFHVANTSMSIYDPVANIAASMQYVRHRYHVSSDGSDLAKNVQQADPARPPHWY